MLRTAAILLSLVVLSCSQIRKYESLPEVLAWEKEIRKFEELDKVEAYPENAILFTGSSSIRLWKTLAGDMAPYPVIRRGFGGSKLSDFTLYAERIIAPHPCSAIVIFVANDITGGNNDKTPKEVAMLYRHLVKTIRKTHKDTPVFWIEVTPTSSRWKVWPQMNEANRLISEMCSREKNTYFISTQSSFLRNGKPMDEYFVSDKLHLNEEGYKLWTRIIRNEINKVVPVPDIEIIAHRGSSYEAPENTVAAAKLAWEHNSDAVECDIHLSNDGRIMVSHDAGTKRTSGVNLTIKNTNSEDLRKLDVGAFKNEKYRGEKIPFLEEMIATVPSSKELVIEIKCGPEVLPELKKVIGSSPKDRRYVFIAFDFNTISLTKEAFPENPCYWLCSNPELLQKNIGLAKDRKLDGFSLSHSIITEEVAWQIRKLDLELFTWTVDDPDEARRLISLGVKGITTNRPDYIAGRTNIIDY